jgi:hypothetical protein
MRDRVRAALRGLRPQESGGPGFVLSRRLFLRALAVVYVVAFVSLAVQVTGLVGDAGILPVREFLRSAREAYGIRAFHLWPTLLWWAPGDATLLALAWGGAALAALLLAGAWPRPLLLACWACYLSLTVAGQVFLNFQWDALLLETGLLGVLYAPPGRRLGGPDEPPPWPVARWLLWWCLVRLLWLSGATKLASGDPAWASWTALDHHFETQPLPTWTAWFAHRAPAAAHRALVGFTYFAELVLPLGVFAPARGRAARYVACAGVVALQCGIAATGNYGFFNLLTIVLALSLLDDDALRPVLRSRERPRPPTRSVRPFDRVAAGVLFALSLAVFAREIAWTRRPGVPSAFDRGAAGAVLGLVAPFRSVNGYGLFRVMTTERPELAVEVSRDGVAWRELDFRWKPDDPRERPRFVAPHMPRLDWQMWFAALDPRGQAGWLLPFAQRILEGAPPVVRLLRRPPFPGGPPRLARIVLYRYRFTTPTERARTGAWWHRERISELTPPLTLRDGRLQAAGPPPGGP